MSDVSKGHRLLARKWYKLTQRNRSISIGKVDPKPCFKMKWLLVMALAGVACAEPQLSAPQLPAQFCLLKQNGFHADPFDCRVFVFCHSLRLYLYVCPAGHYFNPITRSCDPNGKIYCQKRKPSVLRMRKPISCRFKKVPNNINAALWLPSGYMYFFKGAVYYKFHLGRSAVVKGYPKRIKRDWKNMPCNPDATMYIPGGGIYFFKGTKYYKYKRDTTGPGYEINTHWKGIPSHVDAAFYWPFNRKVYFLKGSKYWRFSYKHGVKKIDYGYPKYINKGWRNMPSNINAVVTMPHGKIYFIKDKYYYEYESPRCLLPSWNSMRISKSESTDDEIQLSTKEQFDAPAPTYPSGDIADDKVEEDSAGD